MNNISLAVPEYHEKFKCKPDCKAECCGCIPFPKWFIKTHKRQIQRKFSKLALANGYIYPMTKNNSCIFLNSQFKCAIYPARPHICKMYGHVEELPCPYIDLDGNERSLEEIKKIKMIIRTTVHEAFESYNQKYGRRTEL